jgi:hypothetical protein
MYYPSICITRLRKAMRTSQTELRFSMPRFDPRRSLIKDMSGNHLTTTFTELQAVSKKRDSVVWSREMNRTHNAQNGNSIKLKRKKTVGMATTMMAGQSKACNGRNRK